MGRPRKFTPELGQRVLERIESGDSLRAIERRGDGWPTGRTIRRWERESLDEGVPHVPESWAGQFQAARREYWFSEAELMLEIADDGTNDFVEMETRRGKKILLDKEAVMRSKLRIDTRKWLLGKMLPKVYGPKVSMEHTGEDGGPIKTIQVGAQGPSTKAEQDAWLTRVAAATQIPAASDAEPEAGALESNGHVDNGHVDD